MIFDTDESASITEQAAEMMQTFLKNTRKPPRDGQWKDKYKGRVMQLLWRCQLEKKVIPVDLVVLIGCLFGERHSWSYAKFEAVTYLAQEYEPIQLGQSLPKGAKSALSKIIKKHRGELKTPRKLDDKVDNIKHDYKIIHNRAGYWRDENDVRTYYLIADGINEALKGFDLKLALDLLEQSGIVPAGKSKGERANPMRVRGKVVRLYKIDYERLQNGGELIYPAQYPES